MSKFTVIAVAVLLSGLAACATSVDKSWMSRTLARPSDSASMRPASDAIDDSRLNAHRTN